MTAEDVIDLIDQIIAEGGSDEDAAETVNRILDLILEYQEQYEE